MYGINTSCGVAITMTDGSGGSWVTDVECPPNLFRREEIPDLIASIMIALAVLITGHRCGYTVMVHVPVGVAKVHPFRFWIKKGYESNYTCLEVASRTDVRMEGEFNPERFIKLIRALEGYLRHTYSHFGVQVTVGNNLDRTTKRGK